jgi:alpha-D-glucose phosphate-specific phosphoglucomutase
VIKFGTDGWRAIISDEFTFANVRRVAEAIASYLIKHGYSQKPVIIGYDPRFLADRFAEEVARVMEEAGIDSFLTERDTPIPVVAWEVRDKRAAGAVMLTASHNPAEYCGIKFIPDYAGPANEAITSEIQEYSNQEMALPRPEEKGKVERFEPRLRYMKYIGSLVDPALIRQAKLKVVCDPMYGAGRGYLGRLLQDMGVQTEEIHGQRDVLFGGMSPEPSEEKLQELKSKVLEISANVGLANDGDADRFGVVDEKGVFLNANQVIPLVLDYLVADRGFSGSVVRSVATTHFIDRVAERHKLQVHETPVGFKHIAQIMMKEDVVIGGEESGGFSIKGHIPEKDGILANLLVVDMLARRKKPLSEIWNDLVMKMGEVFTERVDLRLSEGEKNGFMKKLCEETPREIAGAKVMSVNKIDGVKMILADGSWVLARPSGTEPLIRVYAESDKRPKLSAILESVKNLV